MVSGNDSSGDKHDEFDEQKERIRKLFTTDDIIDKEKMLNFLRDDDFYGAIWDNSIDAAKKWLENGESTQERMLSHMFCTGFLVAVGGILDKSIDIEKFRNKD